MDKFADMAMFVCIVKHQGLAAAGRELGLSPATVTMRLQALEERYSVKLLNRSTRHISLTESGVLYHQACLEILETVQNAENRLQSATNDVSGMLKISAPVDIGKQYISQIVSEFIALYSKVTPYLYLQDDLINITESGLDIVIRYGELADSNLISRQLISSRRVVCASPKYLARKGTLETPNDLVDHDCLAIVRNNEPLKNWYFQKNQQQKVITVAPTRFSDNGEIIRQWALDGAGIALKSMADVAEDIKQQRLVTLLDDYTVNFNASSSPAVDLNVIYVSKDYQPKRVRLFIDFIIDKMKNIAN